MQRAAFVPTGHTCVSQRVQECTPSFVQSRCYYPNYSAPTLVSKHAEELDATIATQFPHLFEYGLTVQTILSRNTTHTTCCRCCFHDMICTTMFSSPTMFLSFKRLARSTPPAHVAGSPPSVLDRMVDCCTRSKVGGPFLNTTNQTCPTAVNRLPHAPLSSPSPLLSVVWRHA